MKLTELFSLEELDAEIREGFVKVQVHPTLPLSILNYTDKATYDRRWNNVTRHCRGLIFDVDHNVIARGPAKFFNYGEQSANEYPLDTQVRLTRKEDGSLGIGWHHGAHHGIATRGSFTSEQAVHAAGSMGEDDEANIEWAENGGHSRMWEIVYPDNRIVLDYGTRDELIPLGTVDNRSGLIVYRPNSVLVAGQSAIMTLAEAIALPIPDDEEGYVLDILDEYLNVVDHLKLKGAEYLRRHKLIFNLSERSLYRAIRAGTHDSDIAELPDEWQGWAKGIVSSLEAAFHAKLKGIENDFSSISHLTSRKDFAAAALSTDNAKYLFLTLDGEGDRLHEAVWESVAP